MAEEEKDCLDFVWRESYHGLFKALSTQCARKAAFINAASRIALAIMVLHRECQPLTIDAVVSYVHDQLAPQGGWKESGPDRFDRAEYEQRVWAVVAALKEEHPGQALIYVA